MRISRKFVFLAAMAVSPLASAGPGDELKALIEQGKAAEAYDQGQAGNSHFGDPVFDFYFGVAAIESGHPSEGILALERYLLNFPQNGNARLELARGYFAIGDDQRAREEFNAVLPGADGAQRAAIERYLDAIRERESRYKKTAGLFVEAGIGVDSNVNGGVGNSSLVLPVLGPVTVLPAGTRTGDAYSALALGAHASAPIAPGMTLFGTLQADGKFHAADQEFDQTGIGALGGLSFLSGKDMYRAMLSRNTLWVESDRFRTVTALTGDWQRSLDEWQAVNASLQYGRLDYAGDNSVRDSDLWGISVGYTRGFAHGLQPVLSLSASLGKEDNRRGDRNDLSRDIFGFRAAVGWVPAPRWNLSAGLSYQESRYGAPDAILGVTRRDHYWAGDLTAIYSIDRAWSLRASAVNSHNSSAIDLYDFKRSLLDFRVRYEFK